MKVEESAFFSHGVGRKHDIDRVREENRMETTNGGSIVYDQ